MSLRQTLRKAAGLLVELPPDPEEPAADSEVRADSAPQSARNPELEKLLAEINSEPPPPSAATVTAAPTSPPPAKTVEQIVQESPGPNLQDINVPATASPTFTTPDGMIDFIMLYQQAGLPPSSFTAEQMLDMLASLPPELPLETKRQTVKVTLNSMGKALGATPDTIVADASRKLAALTAYVDNLSKHTAEFVSATEMEIAALQAQMEQKRAAIQEAQQKQTQTTQACSAESNRLDDVLEFFSLDVSPSKYAPPPQPKESAT